MAEIEIRKIVTGIEEVWHDGGPPLADPVRKGAIGAVIRNPYAGRYVEDIAPMMEALRPLALDITRRLIAALDAQGPEIEAYGKGAIVGVAGELEHAALWHQPSGWGIREAMGGAKAIVPSTVKVAAAGARIDIPLHHANAAYVRSHFDAMEVGVADGPRPDELLFAIAMACGPRVHDRMGGLAAADISVWDGQR
jgi:hypothetical protein